MIVVDGCLCLTLKIVLCAVVVSMYGTLFAWIEERRCYMLHMYIQRDDGQKSKALEREVWYD
jgi:hypothetical protein